ncbi:tRNA pseudouridine(55) synthase TruB [Patescibacteria group bacterium]|nr:tRNA pseudouridine(55) synthase TruB [Patescibacteria group bacterium]
MLQGIVAVYKPKGPTSHDIVNVVRRITGEKRVGHAGTLDPLASGVLVVGIGREATKKLSLIVGKEKEYIATIKLGATSTTDDEEGEKRNVECRMSNVETIQRKIKQFSGVISQVPPVYSAVKVDGKEAYKYARKGKEVELKPRKVLIKEIEIIEYSWPLLRLRVVTGPGVYIRALARDIGGALGVGGYLASLERTRVGDFTIHDAIKPDILAC